MPIEPASHSDIPRLCDLLALLFTQESEFSPNLALQSDALRLILDSPEFGELLVLREGGQIIGMVSLLYTISTALGGRVALLEDMVVDPAQRGKGYGGVLVNAAMDHARKAGCRRITLLTDEHNVAARRFYEAAGFKASSMLPYRLQLLLDR